MALFTVSRYLGEDESSEKQVRANDILKNIQSQAKARKKSLEKNKIQSSDASDNTQKFIPVIDKLKNKIKQVDIINAPSEKPKKKKKTIEIDEEDETVKIVEVQETDNEQVTKIKEKKKKRKEQEISDGVEIDIEDSPKKKKSKKEKDRKAESDKIEISLDNDKTEEEEVNGEQKKVLKKKLKIDGPTDVGGFTVLGSHKPPQLPKVTRVLPDWLSHPTEISRDLTGNQLPVCDMPWLNENLLTKLQKNGITHFFPVQQQVIPALLGSSHSGFHVGPAGYRPSDICVSAPTGSGKTLAFVVPIVQALQSRVTCEVRALAVLPVQDLAKQVYQVFQTYCQDTCLKVGLLTGQKPFYEEQNSLVKRRLRGYISQYDIIVATPGRLVDHINQTEGFSLGHLRYLVIDEADRMMEDIKQDWLIQVENAAYKSRPQPGPITATACRNSTLPLQKLLYSATLSQNPEKLQQLNLFQPKLFTSVNKSTDMSESRDKDRMGKDIRVGRTEEAMDTERVNQSTGNEDADEYIGKYITPDTLTEFTIKTTSSEKPLLVLHMLHNLKYKNILCFTNSVESTHRLYSLIKAYGGVEVREFSSGLKVVRRNEILRQFMAGKIDIIICSDAMARGMDIGNVNYVINYDSPSFIQNYIHRIGRTARAGKQGSAFTFLQEKEFFHFKKMLREAGKRPVKEMRITRSELKPLIQKFEIALKQVSITLEEEKNKRSFSKRKESSGKIEKADKQDP